MVFKKELYPWFLLFILSLIWGSSPILIKKALVSLSPYEIGSLRLTFAAVVLIPFLGKNFKEIKKKDYLILFISGIVGNVIPYFLYPIAQTNIDSATSGVLTSLTPFFALLIGVVFYKQNATKNNIIGLITGFVGTTILIIFSSQVGVIGNNVFGLFVVLATLLYGINLNLIKYHLNHLKPVTITSFSIVSILPVTFYILLSETPFIDHMNNYESYKLEFFYVFVLGFLSTSVATLIFYNLIKIKDTVFASMVTYLMPIVAIFIGIADGEIINIIQVGGMILILTGVFINSKD
tara:strand:+ start:2165 stop:3043 length:879 start_codon:yes stop_codon:yes gene_type:complete